MAQILTTTPTVNGIAFLPLVQVAADDTAFLRAGDVFRVVETAAAACDHETFEAFIVWLAWRRGDLLAMIYECRDAILFDHRPSF